MVEQGLALRPLALEQGRGRGRPLGLQGLAFLQDGAALPVVDYMKSVQVPQAHREGMDIPPQLGCVGNGYLFERTLPIW